MRAQEPGVPAASVLRRRLVSLLIIGHLFAVLTAGFRFSVRNFTDALGWEGVRIVEAFVNSAVISTVSTALSLVITLPIGRLETAVTVTAATTVRSATFPSMARATEAQGGESRLVAVKAVSDALAQTGNNGGQIPLGEAVWVESGRIARRQRQVLGLLLLDPLPGLDRCFVPSCRRVDLAQQQVGAHGLAVGGERRLQVADRLGFAGMRDVDGSKLAVVARDLAMPALAAFSLDLPLPSRSCAPSPSPSRRSRAAGAALRRAAACNWLRSKYRR